MPGNVSEILDINWTICLPAAAGIDFCGVRGVSFFVQDCVVALPQRPDPIFQLQGAVNVINIVGFNVLRRMCGRST